MKMGLKIDIFLLLFLADQRHGNSTVFDHPIIGFEHQPPTTNGRSKPLEKEIILTQEKSGPPANSLNSSSGSTSTSSKKNKQQEQTTLTQKVPHAPQQFNSNKKLEIT